MQTHFGAAGGYRRRIVLDDAKERLHRLERVIRRLPFEKLDDDAADRPDIRSCRSTCLLDNLGSH
jgi:hypothetical protein